MNLIIHHSVQFFLIQRQVPRPPPVARITSKKKEAAKRLIPDDDQHSSSEKDRPSARASVNVSGGRSDRRRTSSYTLPTSDAKRTAYSARVAHVAACARTCARARVFLCAFLCIMPSPLSRNLFSLCFSKLSAVELARIQSLKVKGGVRGSGDRHGDRGSTPYFYCHLQGK